jgi:hypothetical protein
MKEDNFGEKKVPSFVPEALSLFVDHLNTLRFESTPNYKSLKRILQNFYDDNATADSRADDDQLSLEPLLQQFNSSSNDSSSMVTHT